MATALQLEVFLSISSIFLEAPTPLITLISGPGYGIDTVRVDGNDVLAVLSAVREARKRCLESGRAVLLEAMSYRSVCICTTPLLCKFDNNIFLIL